MLESTQKILWTDEGENALKYLREERKLSDDVIKEFGLGYCPEGIDDYRVAGKIIQPLYDVYSKEIIAISTRVPYTKQFWHESYKKGLYLYGLNIARKYIIAENRAIIVEGEFDVTYLHSKDIRIAVACLGSSLSIIQAALLARYCSRIYLLFDGDEGGQEATKRAAKMISSFGLMNDCDRDMIFIPVKLPKGFDPDDYVEKYGKDGLYKLLDKYTAKAKFSINKLAKMK